MTISATMVVPLALFLGLACAALTNAQQTDAVSREITVFNDLINPVAIREAASREVTVYNNLSPPVVFTDAVSREVSVENAFGCITDLGVSLAGNLTDDGLVTLADVTPFVNVLIGVITDPYLQQAADMNCDGKNDGSDIQLFMRALLGP